MAPPVRLGLVGAGRWGQNYIRTIATLEGIRLARLGSRNPESAKLVPAGCSVVTDWREVLDLRRIDGVIVATPPAVHAEIAVAAVEAGVPVLVEKPLTLNVAEARALRDLVVSRHASAMVAHTHLFHPAYRALKSLVPRFGTIQAIRSEAGAVGPYRQDAPVLWDWGAHDVAMCLDLLCSMPEQVKARIVERRPVEGSLGEVIELELVFASGVHASIRVGNVISKRRLFSVRCEHATLVYDDFAAQKLGVIAHRGGSPTMQPVEIAPDLPLTVVVREFAAASAARCQDTTSLELGVKVVEVLAACEANVIANVADK